MLLVVGVNVKQHGEDEMKDPQFDHLNNITHLHVELINVQNKLFLLFNVL